MTDDNDTSTEPDDSTDTQADTGEDVFVQRRGEILFIYDCRDCLANGTPRGESNRQRIDRDTGEAIVTDVRLKRYIRDELDENGYIIYVRRPDTHKNAPRRDDLAKAVLPDDITSKLQELGSDNPSDEEKAELAQEVTDGFLSNAIDARLFGAALSLEKDDSLAKKIDKYLPSRLQGPLQFAPARSLNAPVQENESFNDLTSVIASSEDTEQGGYGLSDHRIKYGMFPFASVLNENAAEDTHLTENDIELLDSTMWRALKNQTITRSKLGQQPRFYLRVEYEDDNYHVGNLQEFLDVDESRSTDPEDMRSIDDITVDISNLVSLFDRNQDRLHTLHVNVNPRFTASADDEMYTGREIIDFLDDRLDNVQVEFVEA